MRYVSACEFDTWHLMIWEKGRPSTIHQVPFRCRSWRHAGECAHWRASQDFARIVEGIEKHDTWLYIVLTFAHGDWPRWQDQYTEAVRLWSMLRHRLERQSGKLAYIQTWERHRSKGIHVNLLLHNESLHAAACKINSLKTLSHLTKTQRGRAVGKSLLRQLVVSCGFGKIVYCEPMRTGTGNAMAGYLTKLAKELVGAEAKSQIPFDAPAHFRRLRASRGLLPPRINSGMTGYMVFRPMMPAESES